MTPNRRPKGRSFKRRMYSPGDHERFDCVDLILKFKEQSSGDNPNLFILKVLFTLIRKGVSKRKNLKEENLKYVKRITTLCKFCKAPLYKIRLNAIDNKTRIVTDQYPSTATHLIFCLQMSCLARSMVFTKEKNEPIHPSV